MPKAIKIGCRPSQENYDRNGYGKMDEKSLDFYKHTKPLVSKAVIESEMTVAGEDWIQTP